MNKPFIVWLAAVAIARAAAPAAAQSQVATQGSMTAHGGAVVSGYGLVLVNGRPLARSGDMHTCPMVTGFVPHVGGPILQGSPTVYAGGLPVSMVGALATCVGPSDTIATGSANVMVNPALTSVESGGVSELFETVGVWHWGLLASNGRRLCICGEHT